MCGEENGLLLQQRLILALAVDDLPGFAVGCIDNRVLALAAHPPDGRLGGSGRNLQSGRRAEDSGTDAIEIVQLIVVDLDLRGFFEQVERHQRRSESDDFQDDNAPVQHSTSLVHGDA